MKESRSLIRKYNYPVPRYTSYPPANHFRKDFSAEEYESALINSNREKTENISIYIHIPFCKRLCHYCGCFKTHLNNSVDPEKYINTVINEFRMIAGHIDKNRKLSQIHFGGGTPNAIPLKYLKKVNDVIFEEFELIDSPEIALESNPAYLDFADIDLLNEAGFNRISLGIQDMHEDILDFVNRDSSMHPLEQIISYARKTNPEMKINMDFIYGLPKQTTENFLETIQQAVDLKPDRLVTFSYAHVPWVNKAQLKLEKYGLPEQDDKIDMFFSSRELLKKSGYVPIGFDHYVLPDDELNIAYSNGDLHRNFQGYCTRRTTGQVYALGISSISQLERIYASNTKSMENYIEKIENGEFPVERGYQLSEKEIIVREVITTLLSNNYVDLNAVGKKLGLPLNELKEILDPDYEMLNELEKDGVIEQKDNKITVSAPGVLFIRNVAGALDPEFEVKDNKYSKPV